MRRQLPRNVAFLFFSFTRALRRFDASVLDESQAISGKLSGRFRITWRTCASAFNPSFQRCRRDPGTWVSCSAPPAARRDCTQRALLPMAQKGFMPSCQITPFVSRVAANPHILRPNPRWFLTGGIAWEL